MCRLSLVIFVCVKCLNHTIPYLSASEVMIYEDELYQVYVTLP